MINLTVPQLRSLVQLPERPFEDVYAFDGTSYFDLSQNEPCTIFSINGTASGAAFLFRPGIDYQITAGCVDWTLAGAKKPDINSQFTVDYTYSSLGGDTASTSVANAIMIVSQDLGPSFPYNASTTSGISFNALAVYGASLVAARDACKSLAVSDIDSSQKFRRGAVLIDDSKKTDDWRQAAQGWDDQYKRYLTLIRPGGMVRLFSTINRSTYLMLFGPAEARAFDNADSALAGFSDSGIF